MVKTGAASAESPPFDRREFHERVRRVRSRMEDEDIGILLVTEPSDIYYLSGFDTQGFWAHQVLVVPPSGGLTLACFVEESKHAARQDLHVVTYPFGGDYVAAVLAALRSTGINGARIGLDFRSRFLSVELYERLESALPRASFVDMGMLIKDQRMVKSPAEIAFLSDAAAISNKAMSAALDALRVGELDRTIASILTGVAIQQGSDPFSLNPIVRFGPRMVEGHVSWAGQRLRPGDGVELEVGALRRRYVAPLVRFAFAGPISGHLAKAAEVSHAALEAVLSCVAPGVSGGEIWAMGMRQSAGTRMHHLLGGYSVGVAYPPSWSEAPLIAQGSERILRPNMIFHVVSVCQLDELRIGTGDLVRVTETGCALVASFRRGPFTPH